MPIHLFPPNRRNMMPRPLPLMFVATVTALSLQLSLLPARPGAAQGFKFSRSGSSSSARSFARPPSSSSSSRFTPSRGVSRGGFIGGRTTRPRPPVNLGGIGRIPRPGVTFPKPVVPVGPTIPAFPVKPGIRPTLPFKPGATIPAFPVKPGIRPTLPVNPGVGNLLKPKVPGKLDGIQRFETLVGKLPSRKFTPIKLDKLKGLGAITKAKDLQLKLADGAKAKSVAIQKLSLAPGCHWWVDFCIGWHWHHHHCHWWDYCYTPGYWQCWTPCHYHVIYCPPVVGYVSSTWYFGVDCVLIPDMACYGIQKVQPNSPAALAGLKTGDMIVSINGEGVADESVLQRQIQTSGGLLQLGIVRDGAATPVRVDVVLRRVRALSY